MGENTYLPGNILSLAAEVADRLLRAGSGDAALLYLYLLRQGGEYDPARAGRALRWEDSRRDGAYSLLIGLGLAEKQERASAPPLAQEPPEYAAADINRELETPGSSFPALVGEVQRRLGKVLSTNDLKSLYTIYDFTGLPAEVILLAVNWTIEEYQRKYGSGRMPRMPQIQREAIRWKEQGVDTLESAEAHVRRLESLRDRSVRVLALLDIRDRRPVAREQEYITGWVDMGFPDETIRLAYEKTVLKKQSMSWSYMDAILKNWHQKGLHTVKEVEKAEERSPRRRPAQAGAGATVSQPGAPGEANRRVREDARRMREFLKQQEKEGN